MSEKHSGENQAGIAVQIRFIPLKVENEVERRTAKISVLINDEKKGTPDNIRSLELPMISKLEREGETVPLVPGTGIFGTEI
jgi:hypothetical protein